ncbi:MAG: pyridoxal-phosphate dependent enzyme, partial [Anaerolineales bacterium]
TGNMGSALAYAAYKASIPCTVIVPSDAPQVKLNKIQSYRAKLIKVSFKDYQQIQVEGYYSGMDGLFIHPFADYAVVTANATIGIEITEELENITEVYLPYGGGGLICGVAQALKQNRIPAEIVACELETASPLTQSISVGKPIVTEYKASFVSGIGAPFVFPQMWRWSKEFVSRTAVVSLQDVVDAIRKLVYQCHVIAEGAGAVSLAAALKYHYAGKKAVCLITGGNINPEHLQTILDGNVPI